MTRHEESRIMPYKPDQMFDLVADISRYPEFLPWCQAARIRKVSPHERGELVEADLVIAFLAFRERFGSRVDVNRHDMLIDVDYLDGPFKTLKNQWKFSEHADGAKIEFFVEFEFKSRILEGLIGKVFDQAMRRIVHAFETRAAELYG